MSGPDRVCDRCLGVGMVKRFPWDGTGMKDVDRMSARELREEVRARRRFDRMATELNEELRRMINEYLKPLDKDEG